MMKAMEWRFVDKTSWERGPWDTEPDKAQWTDMATGLPCLIVRNRVGALCGYVGVSRKHPLYGVHYDKADRSMYGYDKADLSVHGGLTFSGKCAPTDKEHSICHVVEPDESDDVWWLGFDCAHGGDMVPAMLSFASSAFYRMLLAQDHYRDFAYVRNEVAGLAKQIAEVA